MNGRFLTDLRFRFRARVRPSGSWLAENNEVRVSGD
jgi:hypothetical protein